MLAIGGDLSVDRLILAYSNGIFPWYAFRQKVIQWWCPLQRFVIFPGEIHISHSMRTLMNKNTYKVTFNQAFEEVIRNCSKLRIDEEGAWLGEEMIEAYIRLYEQNLAASVEVWEGDKLVGGTVWRDPWHVFLRREHVLARAQCIQAGPDPAGPTAACPRRYPHRLPV